MTQLKKASLIRTTHDVHIQLAIEQSAMHSARVALARWTSGSTRIEMQLEKFLRPTRQARWHDVAHANFLAWLAAGGFGADVPPDQHLPASGLACAPGTEPSRNSKPQRIPA